MKYKQAPAEDAHHVKSNTEKFNLNLILVHI